MEILEKEIKTALNPLINIEERDKSTEYFNNFYNSFDNILLSLRLILSSNNLTIKFASTIILRHTINKTYSKYKDNQELSKKIHNLIIQCILLQGDYSLFSYFLYSIGPIISSDIEKWNEFQQFYNFQISNATEKTIVYPIIISSFTLEYLPYNLIKSKLIYFLSLAQFSFGVDDNFLIIFSSRIISKLFLKLQPEDLFHLSGPFEFVMNKWAYSIIEGNDDNSIWLNQTVNEVINNQRIPFTPDTFMNFMIDLSSRDLSIFSLNLLYHNIIDFLKFYGSKIENIENVIETILSTASSLFIDGFLNEQSEMLFVLNAFEMILKTTNSDDAISYLFEFKENINEIISDDSLLSELISYLFCVLHCVEITFELCIPYIHILVNLVVNNMSNSNVCVQEISLEIVGEVCKSLHYLHDFDNIYLTNAFISPLFTLLRSENKFVIFRSVRSLIELLHVASIEPDFVGSMIDVLYILYENDINKIYVLEAISSIVFSAETGVYKYSMKIYNTAKKALHSKDLILIATAIESLSNLFYYSHDILDSKATEIFKIFLSFASSPSGDIRSSVAFGFRVFLKNKEKWKSIIFPHFHLILKFIDETLELFIGESTRTCLLDVLRLMKVIVKHYSSSLSLLQNQEEEEKTNENENNKIILMRYEKWFDYTLKNFNTNFIPLHIAAISLSVTLYIKRTMLLKENFILKIQTFNKNNENKQEEKDYSSYKSSKDDFFILLEKDFDNDSPYITSAAINGFARMTELNVAEFTIDHIIEKVVSILCKYDKINIMKNAENHHYISNQMPEHIHHNHTNTLLVRKSIYNYLSVITSTCCERFPLSFLVDHSKVIDEDAEITLYYYTIEHLYFSTVKNTRKITLNDNKETSIKVRELNGRYSYLNGGSRSIILDGFNKCDLFNWPSALISLNVISQELYKNGLIQLCQEILPIIERFIESMFKTNYTHQTSYFQTVYASISIILTLCCAQLIDILKWIPLVIKKFPIKSEFGFADCIFNKITELYEIAPLKLNPFAPNFLYIFVEILAEPDDKFELFNFKRETLKNVVEMLDKMRKLNPQTFVIISTSFLDANSKQMFEKRMAEYSVN